MRKQNLLCFRDILRKKDLEKIIQFSFCFSVFIIDSLS
jgi:hypothetical protein